MNEYSMNNANLLANALVNNGSLLNGNSFGQEHLHKVSGIEGMGTFVTKPNCDYVLFEENSDIFCVKSMD